MANEDFFRKRVVLAVPGMAGVEVRRDLVYGRAEDGDLLMDVYLPPGGEAPRPGVFLVHGGPVPPPLWGRVKNLGVFLSYGELLAASGFVTVTFSHRYLDVRELAASAANIDAAIAFVRERAASFRLDPDRIAVWFFSGGGPLLAPFLREPRPYVRALVAYYSFLDLVAARGSGDTAIPDDVIRGFSPASCFPADAPYSGPPILVARAGLDSTALNGTPINQTIDLFVQRALAANAPLDVMNHAAGQHAFDILDDDARSREILARTVEFLKSHL